MNEQQSFLDPKTILAIFLLGLVWIGWQFHLQEKYPDAYKPVPTQEETAKSPEQGETEKVANLASPKSGTDVSMVPNKEVNQPATPESIPENELKFDDETWSFTLSSKGMGVKDVYLKTYTNREGNSKKIGATEDLLFATRLTGFRKLLDFNISQKSDNQFVGVANWGGVKIVKTILVDSKTYSLDTQVIVSGVTDDFLGLETLLADMVETDKSGGSFIPSFEIQEFFVRHDDGEEDRIIVVPEETVSESFDKVTVLGLSSQYFSMAVRDKSGVMPEVKTRVDKANKMTAALSHSVLNRSTDFKVHYLGFAGPKSLQLLTGLDEEMASLVDFGMFSVIGRVILKIMKGFYNFAGNWGVAIILLTILVRLIVLPFNIMSYKSMKGMQKIQPQLKEIREKYKEDKVKLNQETMALMKEAKANPVGGCLPMLLQFPIFIALYQVIGQSIELYQAPFALWISDLSLKDPYYVLPVLMSLTIFVQQKMTPTQMDPAQQKVMMFMPLIFMVFMISLPSGLTLYMFVSALFAVGQQAFFMRNTEKPAEA